MKKIILCLMLLGLFVNGIPSQAKAGSVAYINNWPSDYWPAYNIGAFLSGMESVDSYQLFSTRGSTTGVIGLGTSVTGSIFAPYDVVIMAAWDGTGMSAALQGALAEYLQYYGGKLIITSKAYYRFGQSGTLLSRPDFPISGILGVPISSACTTNWQLDLDNSDTSHPIMAGVSVFSEYSSVSSFSDGTLKSESTKVASYLPYYTSAQVAIVHNADRTIVMINHQARESCGGNGAQLVFGNSIKFLLTEPTINPGDPLIDVTQTGDATVVINIDDDPNDGSIGASVGSDAYAYGSGVAPFDDEAEAIADGNMPFTVNEAKTLYLHVSVGGVLGGYQLFNSEIDVSSAIKNGNGDTVAQFSGIGETISTYPLPAGFYQVEKTESIPFAAVPGVDYNLEFYQRLYAWATGSGSSGYANFKGSTMTMISDKPLTEFPIADAGVDQIVDVGSTVQLDGTLSSDPQSLPMSFFWLQVGGVPAALSDVNAVSPSFDAIEEGLYTFELVTSNGTLTSFPDYVNVTAKSPQQDPEVAIDIKPGSDNNPINLCSRGVLPVAILGGSDLDVYDINVESIELAGSNVAVRGKKNKLMFSIEMVNSDEFPDLIVHMETENLNLVDGESEVTLTGQFMDQSPFFGIDSVEIVKSECNN